MKHTLLLEAYLDGAWTNVTGEVLDGRHVKIVRGVTDTGEVRPTKIMWTFLDPTDKWRPTNPESPLYGTAGRNVPIRVTVDGSTRAYCEASSFQPEQALGGPRIVHLTAEGLLRRIGRWEDALRSPLYRQLSAQTLAAYWPLEDGRDATSAANVAAGGRLGQVVDGQFGESDDLPGGASGALRLRTHTSSGLGTRMRGDVDGWPLDEDGFSVMWLMKMPAMPPATSRVIEVLSSGRVVRWTIDTDGGSWTINGYDADYNVIATSVVLIVSNPLAWLALRLRVEQSGGNVNWSLTWLEVGTSQFWSISGSYAGTVKRATRAELSAPADDTLFAHLWVGDNGLPFANDTFRKVSAGYRGETAGDRFARLASEAGVDYAANGDFAATMPMGIQRSDTLMDAFKECVRTEDGLLYDSRLALRLVLRTRMAMCNQNPTLTLTWPAQVAPPFEEMIDDEGLFNHVTVEQREGSAATAIQTTGPLSVQPSPDGVGEYQRTVEVNVSDPDMVLPQLAGWWLARGTAQGLAGRYPRVTVDLDALPALAATAASVEVGGLIRITGYDAEPIDLIVMSIDETVHTFRRLLTFTCVNGNLFGQVFGYDDGDVRYDSASTTLKTGVTAGATSMVFRTTSPGDRWSSTGVPYDVMLAGERVTVTAMGASSVVSGAYEQTATVTRAVNGVSKAQSAATEIHIAQQGRWSV